MGTHPIFESDFDCLTESKQENGQPFPGKTEFVRQMLRLRARHQNRLPHELIEQAGPVETHMAKQPKMYDERWCNISNTPLIQQTHVLMRELREMGLYIDEHRDFNEAMVEE